MVMQRVDQGMVSDDKLDKAYEYAVKSQRHLWIVVVTYEISDKSLVEMGSTPIQMDSENMLAMPELGCYICEEPYSSRVRLRRCPGEPKH